jgi:hypothetical protein
MKILLQLIFVISLIIGSLSIDLIEISYNGESHYFEESECTTDIIADCFGLDPDYEITLECDCGSTLLANEDGLFEGISSDYTYECTGTEEAEDECPCIESEIIEPELINGWFVHNEDWPVIAIKSGNTVQLMGILRHSNKVTTTAFELPEGWRPYQTMLFDYFSNNGGRMRFYISPDGSVKCQTYYNWGTTYLFSLDSVSFVVP